MTPLRPPSTGKRFSCGLRPLAEGKARLASLLRRSLAIRLTDHIESDGELVLSTPAGSAMRALCRSGAARGIGQGVVGHGSRSGTQTVRPLGGLRKGVGERQACQGLVTPSPPARREFAAHGGKTHRPCHPQKDRCITAFVAIADPSPLPLPAALIAAVVAPRLSFRLRAFESAQDSDGV
jgi:hypothetical protein